MSTDLSYPIGKFEWKGENTPEERKALIAQIEALPANVRAAVAGLDEAQLNTPYRPDGWTVRQTVHHLADSHMNAFIRFKLALTEKEPTIKPYLQAQWAEMKDGSDAPVEGSLAILDGLHQRWTALLRSMRDDDFKRTFIHPEHGSVITLDRNLALYAWHGRHHTAHVTGLRERNGWQQRAKKSATDEHR